MGNLELLERAFAIADSGEVANIRELRRALVAGGVTMTELRQFHGPVLVRQLSLRIAKSSHKRGYKIGVPFTRQ